MGKTFRRCMPTSDYHNIRKGGSVDDWIDLPSAKARHYRADGPSKNKSIVCIPARSHKRHELISIDAPFCSAVGVHDLVDRSHNMRYPLHKRRLQTHRLLQAFCSSNFSFARAGPSVQPQLPTKHADQAECIFQRATRSCQQQHFRSLEDKLVNSLASAASQLCMVEIFPLTAALKSAVPGTTAAIEVVVPLCLNFECNNLGCMQLQLVRSRGDMKESTTRPWFSTRTCEQVLSSALARDVASALAAVPATIDVSAKLLLGYSRYSFKKINLPLLYIWSTGSVPHVKVHITCDICETSDQLEVAQIAANTGQRALSLTSEISKCA